MSRSFILISAISLGFTWNASASAQTEPPARPGASSSSPAAPLPNAAEEGAETPPVGGSTTSASPAQVSPAGDASETGATAPPASAPIEFEEVGNSDVADKEPPAVVASEAGELPESAEDDPPAPYDGPATLLDEDGESMHLGGYGGLAVLGTSINKSGGLLVGGEGAFLLDHRLALGIAGYGLSSEARGPDFASGDTSILGFGYGGAVFRYHLVSIRSPVTASVGTLIGAGGLTLIQKLEYGEFDYEYDYEEGTPANAFFIAEPSIQVNLHLTKWMRFGVSGGYRFVRGPSLRGVSDGDLEGVTAGGHAQFGWF